MNKLYIYITILFGFSTTQLFAQQENMLYYMSDMPQSIHMNPAKRSDYKVSITLPSAYIDLKTNSLSYRSIFRQSEGSLLLDVDHLSRNLKKNNIIHQNLATDLFGIYVNTKKFSVAVFARARMLGRLNISNGAVELVAKGNGSDALLGQTVDLAPEVNLMGYTEIGGSFNYNVMNKLVVGVTAKYLMGAFAAQTEGAELSILTEDAPNYPLTMTVDGAINSAGAGFLLDDDFEGDELSVLQNAPYGTGFQLDLGGTYQLTNRILLEAAVTGLGSIKWSKDLHSYKLGAEDYNSFTFEGYSVSEILGNTEDNSYIQGVQDSLTALLDFNKVEGEGKSFRSSLPINVNLSGSYEFWRRAKVGAILGTSIYKGSVNPYLSISAYKPFGSIFSLGLAYTANSIGGNEFGGAFTFGIPGIRFYVISDNVFSNIYKNSWETSKGVAARFGVNMNFGRLNKKKKRKVKNLASEPL